MEIIIIFLVITFLFLLSGFPVAFILSGISLLFALIGVAFGYFDYSFLMAFPNRLYGVMGNQNLLAVRLNHSYLIQMTFYKTPLILLEII